MDTTEKKYKRYTNTAIDELVLLQNDCILEVSMVEWWLLKHEESYRQHKHEWKCRYHLEDVDATCKCGVKPVEHVFVELFERLMDFADVLRHESIFATAISDYHPNKKDSRLLRNWESKMEVWAAEHCKLMYHTGVNYLDENRLLHLYYCEHLNTQISVSKSVLPNAIDFHRIWYKVHWES